MKSKEEQLATLYDEPIVERTARLLAQRTDTYVEFQDALLAAEIVNLTIDGVELTTVAHFLYTAARHYFEARQKGLMV